MVVGEPIVDAFDPGVERIDRQAPATKLIQQRLLGGRQGVTVDCTQRINVKLQRSSRGEPRVELPQRPGCSVARIDEGLFAARGLLCIEPGEAGVRHEDFTAHFDHRRRRITQTQRQAAQGPQVGSDVFAGLAIATGGALDELAVLVAQVDCQPVELGFGHVGHRRAVQTFTNAAVEGEKLGFVKRIVERAHGQPVLHRRER